MSLSNKENLEVEKDGNNKVDLKSKFIKDFTKEFLSKKDKDTFIDEIMKNDSISSSSFLEKEIKKFQANHDEFNSFDEKKINIFDLKRAISKEAMSLENSRANYLEYTFSKFDLNEKQQEKLKKELKNIKQRDLEKLISSEYENKKFLKKLFGNNISKLDKISFLDNLTKKDIEKRLENLDEVDRKNIEEILYNFSVGKVYDTDLRDLFTTNFLKDSEKKEILKQFIPYISLEKAVELGIIDLSKATKQKEKILKPLLKQKNIDSKLIDEIIDNASLKDIKVKVENFLIDDNLNIIADNIGFSNIEREFNKFVKDAEEDALKNGPQDLKELKILLDKEFEGKVENLGDFENKSIVRLVTRGNDGKEKNSYLKIEEIDEKNKTILFRAIGDNLSGKDIINFNSTAFPTKINFNELLGLIKNSDSFSFFKESKLKEEIEKGNLNIETSDLKQYTKKDLQNNPELVKELQEKYNNQKDREREILEKEIENIEGQIQTLKSGINDENKKEIEERIKNLETELEQKKLVLASQIKSTDSSISTNDLLQFSNKLELVKKLDELDPEGKDIISPDGRTGLFKGMYLTTKDGIYKITGLDWETGIINLESQGKKGIQKEKLTFEGFYQAFKKNKANRMKPMASLEDFLKENQEKSEVKDLWGKFIVKNGRLEIKEVPEYSKDDNPEVEYLISDGTNEIYKIEDINGDKITFRFGERKKIDKLSDKEKKKYKNNIKLKEDGTPEKNDDGSFKYEGELLSLSKDTQTLTLTEFNKLINRKKKEEFYPDWETGKTKTISNPQDSENKFRGSFMTRLFNNLSLSELIAGGKMMVENIEEYMKKGNEIHAAEFALKLGKMLPDEVYHDLKIKVERAENESMDKEIESLGKVDSPIATQRILDWLINKDTPEYKKEAGLMFMIKKYGHLNAKKLSPFAGKFIWYEAFGGKIGDKLFLDLKAEAEKKNQNFTEEYLMYIFIKKQCGENGYGGIKRRTRLHKEYKAFWPQGVEEELKTGYTDASDERRAIDMVEGGIGEMLGGTHSNAVGWFKKAIERGGSLEDMNEGFFTLLYSGAIYNLDQKTYLKIKGLWDGEKMPVIMARFSSYRSDMELFNKTVLEISNRIGDEYGDEFSDIKSEAKDLFDDAIGQKGKEKERIIRAQKFWKKYGTPLSRALNMNHIGDSKYSKTDKIVILEKDKNPILKEYFESVRGFTTESTFGEDFMDDAMGMEGIAGLNTNEVIKKYAQLYTGGTLKNEYKSIVEKVWMNLSKDINSVSSKEFVGGEKAKKEYLNFMIRDIIAGFIANNGGNEYLAFYAKKSPFMDDLNKWGINEKTLLEFNNFSEDTILSGEDPALKSLLDRIVDNILSGSASNNDVYYNPLDDIINSTKKKTANNTDLIDE